MENGVKDVKIITEFWRGKNNVLVSVIMPVYNVAKYLDECMISLVNQTLRDIEIICVDDGSTDNSLEILKKYAERDDRITIVTQENQRAPIARNNGFKLAKGKYVIHLDSDDFFELDMLKLAYERIELAKAEVCVFRAFMYNDKSNSRAYLPPICDENIIPNENLVLPEDLGKYLFEAFDVFPWNKLYSREFLNRYALEFQNIKSSDDLSFAYTTISLASRITFLNKPFVHYRICREGSIQYNAQKGEPLILFEALDDLKNNLIKYDVYDKVQICFANLVCFSVSQLVANFRNTEYFECLYNYVRNNVIQKYDLEILHIENLTKMGFGGFKIIHHMKLIEFDDFR